MASASQYQGGYWNPPISARRLFRHFPREWAVFPPNQPPGIARATSMRKGGLPVRSGMIPFGAVMASLAGGNESRVPALLLGSICSILAG